MTEANPIGSRIAAFRRKAGFDKAADLAAAIANERITTSVIQNIESGRKSDLSVTQLLEIAHALSVSPVVLLAPMNHRAAPIDIPNVSEGIGAMTVDQFDRWVSLLHDSPIPDASSNPWASATTVAIQRLRDLSDGVREWDAIKDSEGDSVDIGGTLSGIQFAIYQLRATAPDVDLSWIPERLQNELETFEQYMNRERARDLRRTPPPTPFPAHIESTDLQSAGAPFTIPVDIVQVEDGTYRLAVSGKTVEDEVFATRAAAKHAIASLHEEHEEFIARQVSATVSARRGDD